MKNVDIKAIAVKFDTTNTALEFNKCVQKFIDLGFNGEITVDFEPTTIRDYPYLVIDEDGEFNQVNTNWRLFRNYEVLTPKEFLASGELILSSDAVVEWLDKLQYVYNNSDSIFVLDYSDMTLGFRNAPYIKGSKAVVEFINSKYAKLMDIKSNRQELQVKREELLAELAEINKQLNIK